MRKSRLRCRYLDKAVVQISALPPRSAAQEAAFRELMREIFEERIPFNRVLGLKIRSLDVQSPALVFAMRPELIGSYSHGRLHGGVISAVLDTMGGLAVMCAIGHKYAGENVEQLTHRFGRLGTIDLRVDYLHPGVGSEFVATATVTRLGGRIASTQMSLHNNEGKLIATGAGAYVVS